MAGYRFLTPSHMKQLNIASDVSYIRKKAREWVNRPKALVGVKSFFSDPKRGGRENFYFLTKHGKQALINEFKLDETEILYPKGGLGAVFSSQYFHRKHMIHFQIILDQRAAQNEIEVPFFYRDFDMV